MQLHQIGTTTKKRAKKKVGRGGKRGTYSGKGQKGQKSRAGKKMRPQMRDIIKKLPKKRGYRFSSIQEKPTVVNVSDLEKVFENNEKVNPQTLLKKGMIKKGKGRWPVVKLLGNGGLTKKLLVSGCKISESGKAKIEKAGGKYDK